MVSGSKLPFILAAVVVAGAAIAGFLYHANGAAAVHPARGLAVQAVYATGTVEPVVMLPIAPRVGARLTELLADEGMSVRKGDILARFEDEDLRRREAELQARLSFAEKDFARKSTLARRDSVSQDARDRALAERDAATALLAQVRAEQEYLHLLAPGDGTIIRRDGEVGEWIAAGQAVFWLSASEAMRVSAEVDEEDIARVRPGQHVVFRADAFPGEVLEGTVDSITPKGDPVARSYRVRIGLPQDSPLMTGMTAEANIIIRETPDALLLPVQAVQDGAVWRVNDGRLERRKVKTGAQTRHSVEILDGLAEDDLVILEPGVGLEEGSRIRVSRQEWMP